LLSAGEYPHARRKRETGGKCDKENQAEAYLK